jgi:hypothetical protein
MKSKAAPAQPAVKQKAKSMQVLPAGPSGSTGAVSPAHGAAVPFRLDREWAGYALRNAGLIGLTFAINPFLAGLLPTIFAKAFEMPVSAFPNPVMFAGTFFIFAIVRAALSLRLIDHVVTVPSVGKWVLFSVLSDVGFQVVLSVLVPLMPLGFSAQSELVWQFVCAALGGFVTGWLQWRMFQPQTKPQLVWVAASCLGWLVTYALLGAILYGMRGSI